MWYCKQKCIIFITLLIFDLQFYIYVCFVTIFFEIFLKHKRQNKKDNSNKYFTQKNWYTDKLIYNKWTNLLFKNITRVFLCETKYSIFIYAKMLSTVFERHVGRNM